MIKLQEKNRTPRKKITPHYILTYDYMIGDANGNTSEKAKISADNPFIERYVTLLGKLKPIKGTWGIMLRPQDIYGNYKEKRISKIDYEFLMKAMFEYDEDEDEETVFEEFLSITEKEEDFLFELQEGVQAETEYSFLVFQGADLTYIDEHGEKHDTYFE